jgi:tetratricopeptide (TPR) repeat protein
LTSSRRSRLAWLAAALPLLGGCGGAALQRPTETRPIELTDVPFFPGTRYQCGPAALATLLAAAGAGVTADGLVDEVYVPGLRGSLEAELLGATRRHGFIPYVLAAEPTALLAELDAGRPVLVLQNFGLEHLALWHYAVVVGIDARHVILRSGTKRRQRERAARFLRTWQRGANWAFVAIRPGDLPATAAAPAYVRSLAGAERFLRPEAGAAAHAAALERWPDDELVLFAAATFAFEAGDLARATDLYRKLLVDAPHHAAARNNLANVLAARGCRTEASAAARAALGDVAEDDPLYAAIRDTATELARAPAPSLADAHCD